MNNTYSNSSTSIAYENETFQNMTYLNETTGNDDENVNPINSDLEQNIRFWILISVTGNSIPNSLGHISFDSDLEFPQTSRNPSTFIDPHDHTSIFNEDTIVQEESNQDVKT